MRTTLGFMLEALGFEVVAAADGAEALQLGRSLPSGVDLVVSDCMMPGLDGVETVTALRATWPDLRALLASGYPEEDCFRGRTLANAGFLSKPFNLKDLDAAVKRLLS